MIFHGLWNISREANREDNCKGKFWEGRFKSQALLDEKALFSWLAYVDLNPIRVGIASSVEDSEFASISDRIKQHKSHQRQQKKPSADCHAPSQPYSWLPLSPIADNNGILLSYSDYFELVDWSGRHIDPKKTGFIDESIISILQELGIEIDDWTLAVKDFRRHYGSFAGSEMQLRDYAHRHARSWCKGVD